MPRPPTIASARPVCEAFSTRTGRITWSRSLPGTLRWLRPEPASSRSSCSPFQTTSRSPAIGWWSTGLRGPACRPASAHPRGDPRMSVPVFNLQRAHRRIASDLEQRWQRILDNTSFVLGPEVGEFEAGFASYLGVAGTVGVANGTDALVVALRALELRRDDEVLVPAFSFYATAEAVILAGGLPVFCDVEDATLNID